jgi:putative heme-binding domain-containing protein
VHFLIAAARWPVTRGKAQRETLARALLYLDRKIARAKRQLDRNWNDRIGEMYAALAARDDQLAQQIVALPGFGRPGHVIFMSKLPQERLPAAIAAFKNAVVEDPDYAWTNDVVFVIGYGRTPEHYALVRSQYEKYDLRMAVLMSLAQGPEEQDREKYAAGLDSAPVEVVTSCLSALEFLPPKQDARELVALVKVLRRLGTNTAEFPLRERVVKLLERNSGKKFDFVFGTAGYVPQSESVEKWTEWVARQYPEESARQLGGSGADLEALRKRLPAVKWDAGNGEQGAKLFSSRGCAQCHGGRSGLGPDLAGVTGRFSLDDLFIAIALPNRDVSPRYQTTLIETKEGKVYSGLVVYESKGEGILLRNATSQTYRIDGTDIENRRNLPTSLMPEGLLKDLSNSDLADLYAYLKTLTVRTAALDDDEEEDEKK